MTKKVGIIGYPLGHSLSPIFQQAAFDSLNIDILYEAWPLQPKEIPSFIEDMKFQSILGINVTIPYKEIILDYLDDIDSEALSIGAVNTIVNSAGTLIGYNTDIVGFSKALSGFSGLNANNNKPVLILGAGGVARSALRTLIINGFKDITIANRTESRAKELADEFLSDNDITIGTICTDHDNLPDISRSAYLIVNCTSVGMAGDLQGNSLLRSSDISQDSFVYDMVYNPTPTLLMDNAREAGAKVLNGLSMLIHQGAASFKLWTGIEPEFDIMLKAAEEALIMNHN